MKMESAECGWSVYMDSKNFLDCGVGVYTALIDSAILWWSMETEMG